MPPINLWNWSEVSVRCQWIFYQTCWVRKSSSAASTSFFASRSSFSFPAQLPGETVKRVKQWSRFFGAQESTSQQQKSAKKNGISQENMEKHENRLTNKQMKHTKSCWKKWRPSSPSSSNSSSESWCQQANICQLPDKKNGKQPGPTFFHLVHLED